MKGSLLLGLSIGLIAALALGCEDDPRDLGYLKDAGTMQAAGSGGSTAGSGGSTAGSGGSTAGSGGSTAGSGGSTAGSGGSGGDEDAGS